MSNIIKFSKVRDVKTPTTAYDSAGVDLYIPNDYGGIQLYPNRNELIPTGIKLDIPEGYWIEIKNRSSVANKQQLVVGACVVDAGYENEVFIDLHNIGTTNRLIEPGTKIAQMVLHKLNRVELTEVNIDDLYPVKSERGERGFGSSNNI